MANSTKIRTVATPIAHFPLSGAPAKEWVRHVLKIVGPGDVLDVLAEDMSKLSTMQLALMNRLRGDLAKPTILQRSGTAVGTTDVAKRLKCSSEHVRKQIEKNRLVGYISLQDRTRIELPLWQFADLEVTHSWVPELIEALGDNGWGLLDFVTVPRTHLHGGNYLNRLLNGHVDEVIRAAARSNPD